MRRLGIRQPGRQPRPRLGSHAWRLSELEREVARTNSTLHQWRQRGWLKARWHDADGNGTGPLQLMYGIDGRTELAEQTLDLGIGQRLASDRTDGTVLHQRGRLADHELQAVGALLVHHLYEFVESCHVRSQSRGRIRRTSDLLTYLVRSSVQSTKNWPGPLM